MDAHHVGPRELCGVPVADDGDLLAVDRHVVVVNDPAAMPPASATCRHPGATTSLSTPKFCQDANTSISPLNEVLGKKREKWLCSLDVSVECTQGGVILEQVRCLLHAAYAQQQLSSEGRLSKQTRRYDRFPDANTQIQTGEGEEHTRVIDDNDVKVGVSTALHTPQEVAACMPGRTFGHMVSP